ncbi:MAG: hypothetical protein K5656_03815 [Lachnospiraceae bacterium]|nr:hypothetical protein [Lachnospiraceae bacterium]
MNNIILQDKEYFAYQFEGYIFNSPDSKDKLSSKDIFNKTVLYALDWLKLRIGTITSDDEIELPPLIKAPDTDEKINRLLDAPDLSSYKEFDIEPYSDSKIGDIFNIKLLGLFLDKEKKTTAETEKYNYYNWSLRIKEKDNLRDFNGKEAPTAAQNRVFVTDIAISYDLNDENAAVNLSIKTTCREPVSNTILCNSVRTEFIDNIVDDKCLALYSYPEQLSFLRVQRDSHILEKKDIASFVDFINKNDDIGALPFLVYYKHGAPTEWNGLFHMMGNRRGERDNENFVKQVARDLFGYVHFFYVNDTGSKNQKFQALYGINGLDRTDIMETDTVLIDPFSNRADRFKLLYVTDIDDPRLQETYGEVIDYFSPESNVIFNNENSPKQITDHQEKFFMDMLKRISFNKSYPFSKTVFYNKLKNEKWRLINNSSIEDLQKKCVELQGSIDYWEDSYIRSNNTVATITEEKNILSKDNANLHAEIKNLKVENNKLKSNIESLTISRDSVINDMEDELKATELKIAELSLANSKLREEAIFEISNRLILDTDDSAIDIDAISKRYDDYLIFTEQIERGYNKELKDKRVDDKILKAFAMVYVYSRVKYDDSLLENATEDEKKSTADSIIEFFENMLGFFEEPVGLESGLRKKDSFNAHLALYNGHDGGLIENYMDYHVKYSQNSSETFRIHYLYDNDIKKIVVGAAREHLKMQDKSSDGNPGGRL